MFFTFIAASCSSKEVRNEQKVNHSINDIETQKRIAEYNIYKEFILSYNNLSDKEVKEIITYTIKYAKEPKIMLSIFSVESKFKKNAKSYLGENYGIGIGQVSLIALTDYNWKHNTHYTKEDLLDVETNIMISCWIFEYNEKYGIEGLNKKIIAYNEGHVNAKNKNYSKYLDKVLNRAYSLGY